MSQLKHKSNPALRRIASRAAMLASHYGPDAFRYRRIAVAAEMELSRRNRGISRDVRRVLAPIGG